MITVKELIELLSELDEDLTVVLSSDPEGNDFHPVSPDYTCVVALEKFGTFEIKEDSKKSPTHVILWPGYWNS